VIVGKLAGIEPLGITATNDVDALLALKPDVVVYNPMWIRARAHPVRRGECRPDGVVHHRAQSG
jgi:hypothetical protein